LICFIPVCSQRKACHDLSRPLAALEVFSNKIVAKSDGNADLFASVCEAMRKHPDGVDVVADNEPSKKFAVPLVNRASVFTAAPGVLGSAGQQSAQGGGGGQRAQQQQNTLNMSQDHSGADAPAFDSFSASCRGGGLAALWKSVMTSTSVVKLTPGVVKEFWQLWKAGNSDWFIKILLEVGEQTVQQDKFSSIGIPVDKMAEGHWVS
jgi:hypothetical protein